MMNSFIDDRARKNDPLIDNLFMSPGPVDPPPDTLGQQPEVGGEDAVITGEGTHAPQALGTLAGSVVFATGAIQNLVYDKGFGFIRPDLVGENLFFHASDVEGCEFAELQSQDFVRFVIGPNPKDGCPSARQVSRTSPLGCAALTND